MFIKIAREVLLGHFGIRSVIFFFSVTFIALYIFSEINLFSDVLSGRFPVKLFLDILPLTFGDFLFAQGISMVAHYLAISFLMGTYVTFILEIFFNQKYVSLSSLSVSFAGLIGISLGISCLSCGVLGGFILLSFVGAAASPVLIFMDEHLFLWVGEALLVVSNFLALLTLRKFRA